MGLISGLIVSGWIVFSCWGGEMDFSGGELAGYLTMTIALSTIFIGIKTYRDDLLDGKINFGKAFKVGLAISLVASTLYVATWMVVSTTLNEDFATQYQEIVVRELEEKGATQEEIDKKVAEYQEFAELYKNPIVKAGVTYMEILPVGLIMSLIGALVFSRKNNTRRVTQTETSS